MNVVVFYFAALRDLLGITEERLALPAAPQSIADLARHLTQLHPQLEPHLPSVRFAVNESFVDAAAPLTSGDVVALIPPVTGG